MNRPALFFIGIVLCAASVKAQITIDTITTDTVNIFDLSTLETPKSAGTALLLSAVLPGTGHQLMHRPKSALAYLSFDVISFCGAVAFHHYSQKCDQNAKAIAYQHADLGSNSPDDDYFWQIIGNFNSYDDYHTAYPVDARVFSDKLADEGHFWNWGERETFRDQYVTLRKDAKRMGTLSAFFIGAMVLDRLVAVIDLRSSEKNRRYTGTPHEVSLSPVYDRTSSGLILSTTF